MNSKNTFNTYLKKFLVSYRNIFNEFLFAVEFSDQKFEERMIEDGSHKSKDTL